MPPPTLFKKGSLVANVANKELQQKLDAIVPIDYIVEWFRERMHVDKVSLRNRILVLRSDTGSGKSTAFPATLLEKFFKPGSGGIACTQPRIINAVSIVRDLVASGHYPSLKLGKNIGWSTGATQKATEEGLTYMTIGTLVMQLKSMTDDQIMNKYKFIVVDEVHEASLDQAMLLSILKNFMKRNQNHVGLPFVILTSATFNTAKFLRYFGVFDAEDQSNLIQISGFTYPLETIWTMDTPSTDFTRDIAELAAKTHLENLTDEPSNADILIFMPGAREITETEALLRTRCAELAAEDKPVFMVLVIVRETVSSGAGDYLAVFAPHDSLEVVIKGHTYKPFRRIILSTNVAETGVTIETLKYVIDSGFNRTPEYNPNFNTNVLITKAATKAMIRQRMGRANRKSPGVFLPAYPEHIYNLLDAIQLSSVEASDISTIVLPMLYEQIKRNYHETKRNTFNIADIDMLDVPPLDSLAASLETLYMLGFISPISNYEHIESTADTLHTALELIRDSTSTTPQYTLTKMGVIATKFNKLTPQQIRMILAGYAWKASPCDLATIAAWLSMSSQDLLVDPKSNLGWIKLFKEGLPLYFTGGAINAASDNIVYKAKLTISDDFINGLIFFYALSNVIKNNPREMSMGALARWCEDTQIQLRWVIEFIKMREFIIESMISMGLAVFINEELRNLPEESLMDGVVKLKYCIYEGYRCNVAICDENTYSTAQNLRLEVPAIFSKNELTLAEERKYGISANARPRYIVYDSISLVMNKRSQIYSARAGKVCVLDGFVKHDLMFCNTPNF